MDINSLTMKAIEEFMLEQFHPKRFVVRERYKFWAEIRRKPGETIQDLAARIRQDAVTCNFSSITNPQDEAMRTRFICSCENEAVLKALFKIKDDDLSFSRAIEIATQIEDAAKCAKETVYGTSTGSSQIKKIKKPNAPARPTEHAHQTFRPKHKIRQDFPVGICGRCGGPHCGKDCKFKKAVCRFCQKTGHIEKVCLQKRKFVSKIETLNSKKNPNLPPSPSFSRTQGQLCLIRSGYRSRRQFHMLRDLAPDGKTSIATGNKQVRVGLWTPASCSRIVSRKD